MRGKYIEDIRKVKGDKGLRRICKMEKVPSADAIGDWLRREGKEKIGYMEIINKNLTTRVLKKAKGDEFTLDRDAMEIEANKREAVHGYRGKKGYVPIMRFLPEIDWCVGYEFREGNISPRDRNYEFAKEVVEFVKGSGKQIKRFGVDSAAYAARLMNCLNRERVRHTITAEQDVSVKETIREIKGGEWRKLRDKDG